MADGGSRIEDGGSRAVSNGTGCGAAPQQMAVNTGKCDANKNGAAGEAGISSRTHEGMQWPEKPDQAELKRILERIDRDLDETKAELIARGEYDPSRAVVRPVTLAAEGERASETLDLPTIYRRARRLADEVAAFKARVFASGSRGGLQERMED